MPQPLTALKRQTKRFIDEDPTTLVLSRNTKTPDGAGGHTMTPTPLSPQVVKVSQQSASRATERRTGSGEMVSPAIVLVCEWDADVQRDDTFVWQGLDCEVVWVTDLKYVKHAEVNAK